MDSFFGLPIQHADNADIEDGELCKLRADSDRTIPSATSW